MQILAFGLALVFLALAGVHAYWALGGQRGLAGALPTQPDGSLLHLPSRGMVWGVVAGLLAVAALCAAYLRPGSAPGWQRLSMAGLALGLLVRGLGDFRYTGLTKRVKHTTFARRDTRYYTPLCLVLAAGCAALALVS